MEGYVINFDGQVMKDKSCGITASTGDDVSPGIMVSQDLFGKKAEKRDGCR
jgi:hypothetical protein